MRCGIPTAQINVTHDEPLRHVFLNKLADYKVARRRITIDDYFGNVLESLLHTGLTVNSQSFTAETRPRS